MSYHYKLPNTCTVNSACDDIRVLENCIITSKYRCSNYSRIYQISTETVWSLSLHSVYSYMRYRYKLSLMYVY